MVAKASVCQTCGDKGFEDLLLCCSKCQMSKEHRYCLAQIPAVDDEDFTYICSKCTSSSGNQAFKSAFYSASPPSRTFKKLRTEPVVAIVQDLKSASPVAQVEAEVLTLQISIPLETSEAKPLVENVRALPDRTDNDISPSRMNQSAALTQEVQTCEAYPLQNSVSATSVQDVPQLVDLGESNIIPLCPSTSLAPQSIVAGLKYVYAQPIINHVWRGCIQISLKNYGEFVAHLSDKACLQAVKAAKLLPVVLSARMMPRLEIWPKSFHVSAPTDESIALYFFPESESVVKAFDGFIRNIMNCDLALTVALDHTELLIFSSSQLPPLYRRFMGKYYLWGVFRGKKDESSHESENNSGCMPQGNTKMNKSDSLRMSPPSASGTNSSGSLYSQ